MREAVECGRSGLRWTQGVLQRPQHDPLLRLVRDAEQTLLAMTEATSPIRDPLMQHVENIPAQTEIIRMRLRPLEPGHQPSPIRRNVREPIIRTELQ